MNDGGVCRAAPGFAYTGVDFSLKSGFTKIVLTPGLPLSHD